jgi:HEPN domain-containing protein
MNTKAEKWLKIAESDLDTADFCFGGKRYLWTLFMCQQAIEKVLKSLYIGIYEEIPPKKHDLIELAEMVNILQECPEDTKDLFRRLTRYYIKTRYPDHIDDLSKNTDKHTTEALLSRTKKVFEWIKEKLNQ